MDVVAVLRNHKGETKPRGAGPSRQHPAVPLIGEALEAPERCLVATSSSRLSTWRLALSFWLLS
jgi:hypothetical protein